MNLVKVIFNPFLPELKIFINDIELTGYSSLLRYISTPFFVWNGYIFDEIHREVNDTYCMEFQSCKFECEIMKEIAQYYPQCVEIKTKQTEVEVYLQQKFSCLEELAGSYIKNKYIDIRGYSEQQELVEAVGELLVDNGLFDYDNGVFTSEHYPMCTIRYYAENTIDCVGTEEGLHIYVCDDLVDEDVVKILKEKIKMYSYLKLVQ